MPEKENNPPNPSPAIPKPVFMRLLILFGGGVGCWMVGVIVAWVIGDLALLAMSAVLGTAFTAKGFLLKRKINSGQIYGVSGVCVGVVPKILGRYRCIELIDTVTGGDVHFVLPKKVLFKIGHVYTCYFDHPISSSPININRQNGGFFNANMELPTGGFWGLEDLGLYQEKQGIATTSTVIKADIDTALSETIENTPIYESEEDDDARKQNEKW